MRRQKHKNDTKANTHWDRWIRAKGYKWGPFKHSDWDVEGRRKKNKEIEKRIKCLKDY